MSIRSVKYVSMAEQADGTYAPGRDLNNKIRFFTPKQVSFLSKDHPWLQFQEYEPSTHSSVSAGAKTWFYPVDESGNHVRTPSGRFAKVSNTESRKAKKDYSQATWTQQAPRKPKQASAKTPAVWVVDSNGAYVKRTAGYNSSPIRVASSDDAGQRYYRSQGYTITSVGPDGTRAAETTLATNSTQTHSVPHAQGSRAVSVRGQRQVRTREDKTIKQSINGAQLASQTAKGIVFPAQITMAFELRGDSRLHMYKYTITVRTTKAMTRFLKDAEQFIRTTWYKGELAAVHPMLIQEGGVAVKLTGLGHCFLENCLIFAIRIFAPAAARSIYGLPKNEWLAKATAELTGTPIGQIVKGFLGSNPLSQPLVLESSQLYQVCSSANLTVDVRTPFVEVMTQRGVLLIPLALQSEQDKKSKAKATPPEVWQRFGRGNGSQIKVVAQNGNCVPSGLSDIADIIIDEVFTLGDNEIDMLVTPPAHAALVYRTEQSQGSEVFAPKLRVHHTDDPVLAYVVPHTTIDEEGEEHVQYALHKAFNPLKACTDLSIVAAPELLKKCAIQYFLRTKKFSKVTDVFIREYLVNISNSVHVENLRDTYKELSHIHNTLRMICPVCIGRNFENEGCSQCQVIDQEFTEEANKRMARKYTMIFTHQALFNKLIKKYFALEPTPREYAEIIRKAEIFVSKGCVDQASHVGDLVEIDKNRCFPSYTASPYYRGFPTAAMVAGPYREDCLSTAAFMVLKLWDFSKVPAQTMEAISSLYSRCSFECLPVVVFLRLRELGAIFEVDYVLYSTFQKMDLLGYASEHFSSCAHTKLLVNSFIGHTIAGGVDGEKPIKINNCDQDTTSRMRYEADNLTGGKVTYSTVLDKENMVVLAGAPTKLLVAIDLQIISNANNIDMDLAVDKNCLSADDQPLIVWYPRMSDTKLGKLGLIGVTLRVAQDFKASRDARFITTFKVEQVVKPTGSFHWHSFILAYASLCVLDKWLALPQEHKVVAFNTDALYIVTPDKARLRAHLGATINSAVDGWKFIELAGFADRCTFPDLGPFPVTGRHTPKVPQLTAVPLTAERVVITGPGGIGKSYSILSHPSDKIIFCTPTKKLRDEHRKMLATIEGGDQIIVTTLHKYIQPNYTDSQYAYGYENKGNREQFAGRTILIVDELTMFSKSLWKMALHRHKGFVFALGDFMQVVNAMESRAIKLEDLLALGFQEKPMTRQPGVPGRHAYDYGRTLDTLRVDFCAEQVDLAKGIFRVATRAEFHALVSNPDTALKTVVVTACHKRARMLNIHARKCHETIRVELPRARQDKKLSEAAERKVVAKATIKAARRRDRFRAALGPNYTAEQLNAMEAKYEVAKQQRKVERPTECGKIWWDRSCLSDVLPTDMKYEPRFACTAYSLQGSGSGNLRYIVDVRSLRAVHGGLYTAVTRAYRQEQVVLFDLDDDELGLTLCGVYPADIDLEEFLDSDEELADDEEEACPEEYTTDQNGTDTLPSNQDQEEEASLRALAALLTPQKRQATSMAPAIQGKTTELLGSSSPVAKVSPPPIPNHKCYKYLISKGQKNSISECVTLTPETLIVRRENDGFYAFANHQAFLDTLKYIAPEFRTFHELLFRDECKAYFDFDCSVAMMTIIAKLMREGTIEDAFNSVLSNMIGHIESAARDYFPGYVPEVIVCTSKSEGPAKKYSAHLIVNGLALPNKNVAGAFAEKVIKRIRAEGNPVCCAISKCIDPQVYSQNHSLRCWGSTKSGENRVKLVSQAFHEDDYAKKSMVLDTFIGRVEGLDVVEPVGLTYAKSGLRTSGSVPAQKIENIIQAHPHVFEGYKYRDSRGVYVNFNRTGSPFCYICNEHHHHDNALYLQVTDEVVLVRCHQKRREKMDITKLAK